MKQKILYWICFAFLGFSLKLLYPYLSAQNLQFLLYPVNKMLFAYTGCHPVYIPNQGYYYEDINILLERSCSGYNFWILSFFLFGLCLQKNNYRLLYMPISLLLAYFFTLGVNFIRIVASIVAQQQGNRFLPAGPHYLIHEIVGVVIQLFSIALLLFLFQKYYLIKS